jgi:threonine dehydratase
VVKALAPATRVVGVEPQASDDVARSKAAGRRERVEVGRTIADGQQLPTPGERTWPVIDALVDEVVTVSDEQIVAVMVLLFERVKVVVEPSGASALAALLTGTVGGAGQRVGVVLSGANVDAGRFAALVG